MVSVAVSSRLVGKKWGQKYVKPYKSFLQQGECASNETLPG